MIERIGPRLSVASAARNGRQNAGVFRSFRAPGRGGIFDAFRRLAAALPGTLSRLAGVVGPALCRTLALGAVLALFGAAAPAFAQLETEHWSATLTRADLNDDNNYGYIKTGLTNAGGTLDPSTFTHNSVSYTVDRLYVATGGLVLFETDPALPTDEDLVLRVPSLIPTGTADCPAGGTVDLALADAIAGTNWQSPACLSAFTGWKTNLATTVTVKLLTPPPGRRR